MHRRWAITLAFLTSGCSLPLTLRRPEAVLPPPEPSACHLVLWWKDDGAGMEPKPPPDAPARAAKVLMEDRSRAVCPEIRSWQIAQDPSQLATLAQVWRTDLPVLWVAIHHNRAEKEKQQQLQIQYRARLQSGPFDTTEDPAPQTTPAPPEGYDGAVRSAAASLRRLTPLPPDLTIHKVEGPHAAEALQATQSGDWKKAAELWASAAKARPDFLRAIANAGVAAELAGDLKAALDWESALFEAAGGSLVAQLKLVFVGLTRGPEREATLNGLIALTRPPIARLEPASTLAVLPLDNETPDFEADERVRKSLSETLGGAGYKPLPFEDVDQRLKLEGVTMAGHLKALKWDKIGKRVKAEFLVVGSVEEYRIMPVRQVRARLRLIHAPTGQEVLATTLEAGNKRSNSKDGGAGLAMALVSAVFDKASKKTLAEESREVAEGFVGPWPHFPPDKLTTPSP